MANQITKENKLYLAQLRNKLKENKQHIKVRDEHGSMVELGKLRENIKANKSIIMS